eukprot:TRINITY_DN17011_c1_g4_i1.p1 TRINITY_DN17011_c1_g4~~TRINITY_DN17011_c1_g4_i1.p1  ORF type:complete len:834 (-),score=105.22 TRINITY_DN17011_c1_g4_i1:72-2549(-)
MGGARPAAVGGMPRDELRERSSSVSRRLAGFRLCVCAIFARAAVGQGPIPGIQSAEPLLPRAVPEPPRHVDSHLVLNPSEPVRVKVAIGEAKYFRYNCMTGPADVVVSLYTYEETSDPILVLSVDPRVVPTLQNNKAVSDMQWRDDSPGHHNVLARAVGPKGGVVGVLNTRYFAGEELNAVLSLRCAAIVTFDALFWDHLRSSAVCPVGRLASVGLSGSSTPDQGTFCSGRGRCEKYGVCECDGAFTGPACEHGKADLVVRSSGRKTFEISTGKYEYFRVRVPRDFAGGVLRVSTNSDVPIVVLAQMDSLPTKSKFATSNFDAWLSGQLHSEVYLKVPPGVDAPHTSHVPLVPASGRAWKRRLLESSNTTLARALQASLVNSDETALSAPLDADVLCPQFTPATEPLCHGKGYTECEDCCRRCLECPGGPSDESCGTACTLCQSSWCSQKLMACASSESCRGTRAQECAANCGGCLACLDSNDLRCGNCGCCTSCLPLGAKCGLTDLADHEYEPYAFVGVFNHRHFYNERASAHVDVNITLVSRQEGGGTFPEENAPDHWIANLYDPFHDLRSLSMTQHDKYPDGERFLYDLVVQEGKTTHTSVRVFRDRLTLLHVLGVPAGRHVEMDFGDTSLTHVLTSSVAAPKTFFDFDNMLVPSNKEKLRIGGGRKLWIALFAGRDASVQVNAHVGLSGRGVVIAPPQGALPHGGNSDGASVPVEPDEQLGADATSSSGPSALGVLATLCCLMVFCTTYGNSSKFRERLRTDDPNAPLSERITGLLTGSRPHESTASLTRAQSLSGFAGDDMDPSVEAEYLNRGGFGDDGI